MVNIAKQELKERKRAKALAKGKKLMAEHRRMREKMTGRAEWF